MESAGAAVGPGIVASTIEGARVRRLVLWYVGASTAFFFVSGLLGMLLRESQADLAQGHPGGSRRRRHASEF
jgi:hypothetical protein